ncbi:phage tail tape measure protein [Streptomyces sp. NPDC006798]|uniref:phage tail tape measure protein n=1 Tax=unclassified Streptomyces TaxID=2593676 RepID=UPI0033E40986
MANIELGTAYISVLPSTNQLVQGIRDALRQGTRDAQTAGNQMGDNLASGITSSLGDVGQEIREALNEGASAARTAGSDAGDDFSSQFESGLRGVGQRFRSLFNGAVQDADNAGAEAGQRFHTAFSNGMERVKQSMTTALAAGGLAAGGAAAAGLLEGMSQEAASDKLAASMGLTGDQQKKFGNIAGDLYKKGFGESVGDNQLTVQAVLAGLPDLKSASKQAVKDVATDVSTIADLTGEEATTVVNAAKQMVVSGLAKNHQEAMDMIMKGNQLGLNSSQDMLDTFTEYSPYFAELGLTGQQTLGVLQQGLAGGARNLDVLGDSFKEFSIISKDGSDTAKEGFKAIGINAEEASKAMGKGGPAAAAMTGKVIEGLKAIKDPLKQEAAGVALFGTMWEDNSQAILATDLSGAAKQIGDISGTVDKAGKTAHDNAKGNFETFYRTLKQNFVEYIGNKVIPMVMSLGQFIKENATAFKILGGAIAGIIATAYAYRAALWAIKIAQDAMALAKFISNIQIAAARQKIVAAATKAWAFAQRILNAVLRANPIGLIITGLTLLVGGLILAYKKSETFRNIVNGVWNSIKTAISTAWEGYIKPALTAFWSFIKDTLWPMIQNFWTGVVQPVFKAIGDFIKSVWDGIKLVFDGWVYVLTQVLWPALQSIWDFVKLVFEGIWTSIQFYWGLIKGVWEGMKWVIDNVLRPAFQFIWDFIKMVFEGIWSAIKFYWGLIKGVFDGIKWVINNVVVPAFKWVWEKVSQYFGMMKDAIVNVWERGIKPVFNFLKNFITDTVVPGFKKGIDKIGEIWNGLKSLAAKPINFLIEWVYNKGIRRMINAIPGVDDLAEVSPIKFARGGSVTGGTRGKDSVNAMLMPGEHVWTTKEVRAMGGQKNMYALRAAVRNGTFSMGEAQHYAKGGAVKNPSERVYWDGEPITRITAAQLALAQELSGSRIRVMQGSWQPRTSYSGTSHGGPGVVDTSPGSFDQQYYLRRVGFAAWARNIAGAATAGSGAHVHSVSRLDPGAKGHGQLAAFNSGGNGLGGRDYGPNPALLPGLLDRLGDFGNLSVYGGSSSENSSWLKLVSTIKDVIENVRKVTSGGFDKFGAWGGMAFDAAKAVGANVVQWINDKIPNRFLPDNPIPSIFDQGGVLQPGQLAYNASRRPEAVFNHSQFKSFAESAGSSNTGQMTYEMTVTNWDKGTGYIRAVARDEVDSAEQFNTYRRRMN